MARLNVGVAVFFVISGFLLYRPLLAARMGDGPPVRLGDYARRRTLRIVPAYWVALTVLAVYPGLPDMFSGRWWVYYGFGQDYGTRTVVDGIGPAWSLGCEVVFYALLPFLSLALAYLARRLPPRPAHPSGPDASSGARSDGVRWRLELGILGGLCALSFAWRAFADAHPSIPPSTFASTFLWFALGMGLAVASVTLRDARIARYAWIGWVIAAIAYIVICRGLGLSGAFVFFQRPSTAQDLAVYALSGVVAVGLALPAAFERTPRRAEGRLLGSRALAWLGLVSYGVYLYHQPIANALNGGIRSRGDATLDFLWLAAATAAIAICAAAASYYLVEQPVLRLKDRRARRSVPALELAG
jgi:peptidoglycan/LPS O-acetylase OafA/YrhL